MPRARTVRRALSLVLLASPAIADDHTRAQELFEKARAFVKADKHAEACPLFEQALALEAGLGTELNLALCWSKIGKLVDAAKLFDVILKKTEAPDQAQRHQIAAAAAKDVADRMPKLSIDRGAIDARAAVRVDGVELVDASEPVAVDPGKHVVEADGATTQTVTAVEKQVTEVVLVAGEVPVEIPEQPERPGWFWGDKRPLIVSGVGVGMIVAGMVTGVLTLSKKSDGIAQCEGPESALVCGPEGRATLDSARTLSHVTTGLFVVGTGLIVTGVIWKLQQRTVKPERAVVTGWVSGAGGGLALERTW